jgi:hypothetical protein
MNPIDDLIRQALLSFIEDIRSGWRGREHEAVSLFAFAHLLPLCKPQSVFYDPSQICIEGAVPQISFPDKKQHKDQTNKDLLVWSEPKTTYWDENYKIRYDTSPLALMEWKVKHFSQSPSKLKEVSKDIAWLQNFTSTYRETIGYAVGVEITQEPAMSNLLCTRIYQGQIEPEPNWLGL